MVEEPAKVGDPWTILPIKNAKYARDLVEVHLADRELDYLEHFEDFPNLEAVWLNNNKVSLLKIFQLLHHISIFYSKLLLQLRTLDAISTNFRIKKVYAENNVLDNIEGLKKFKFLDTLLLSGNRLRNLDKFISFLQKFAFLEHLDLFGNPLSEEPDYRLKVIYNMPQIKILDRHPITHEERLKASKLDPEYEKKLNKKVQPTKHKPVKVSQALSKGEKDLYTEVNKIKQGTIKLEKDEE